MKVIVLRENSHSCTKHLSNNYILTTFDHQMWIFALNLTVSQQFPLKFFRTVVFMKNIFPEFELLQKTVENFPHYPWKYESLLVEPIWNLRGIIEPENYSSVKKEPLLNPLIHLSSQLSFSSIKDWALVFLICIWMYQVCLKKKKCNWVARDFTGGARCLPEN